MLPTSGQRLQVKQTTSEQKRSSDEIKQKVKFEKKWSEKDSFPSAAKLHEHNWDEVIQTQLPPLLLDDNSKAGLFFSSIVELQRLGHERQLEAFEALIWYIACLRICLPLS